MKYPRFLSKNGAVGFAAPSFGCNVEPYKTKMECAISQFMDWGHPVMVGPNCFLGEGVGISNTPALCAKELTDLYCSRENAVLLSVGGGELMNETIEKVDWKRIEKAEPKWFMGYSDNTNFSYLLTTKYDTASVYGPNAASFGIEPLHESLTDAYRFLCGESLEFTNYEGFQKDDESLTTVENPRAPFHTLHPFDPVFFDADGNRSEEFHVTGRLLGGCMDVLANLRGTKYDCTRDFARRYQEDGILWFLEACELNPMSVRRTLWAMKESGWFRHVKGFLIGRPMFMDMETCGLNQMDAVVSALSELHVPIAYGLDFGHLPPSMPIVCGAIAEADGEGKNFRIQYTFR